MVIIPFQFDATLADAFLEFPYALYQNDPRWIPPLRQSVAAQLSPDFSFYRQPGNCHCHFVAMRGETVLGRISAMVNRRLKDRDGQAVGTIGFFECIHDQRVARELLKAATQWLSEKQQIVRIWGPMNFDIWYGYRMMTRGFDRQTFPGEPYNKPYYPRFFERFGFTVKQHWHSLDIEGRTEIESMIAPKAERYHHLLETGYRFGTFSPAHFECELEKLHGVLTRSFSNFLGFTPISAKEFVGLFAPNKPAFYPPFFTFAYNKKNTLVGFASAFLDLSDALRAMRGRTNLLSKLRFFKHRRLTRRILFYLGGLTPEEVASRSGLVRGLFYHILQNVLDEGYEDVTFALMAKGNPIRGLMGGRSGAAQRQYTLYEFQP